MESYYQISDISYEEIDMILGGSSFTEYAAHISAVSGIVAGVSAGMGFVPLAVGAGVVSGLAGCVAAFA